jgi:hypothetical protein
MFSVLSKAAAADGTASSSAAPGAIIAVMPVS